MPYVSFDATIRMNCVDEQRGLDLYPYFLKTSIIAIKMVLVVSRRSIFVEEFLGCKICKGHVLIFLQALRVHMTTQ